MTSQLLLPRITIDPDHNPSHCTIWLHGLGADGNDFTPITSDFNSPIKETMRFIFPHAPIIPVTINGGYPMRAWFDIYDASLDRKIDTQGIERSKQQICDLIEYEVENGIPYDHIFLAGFSQGAVIALLTAMTHEERLAGVIALSGYLPLDEHAMAALATPQRIDLPIFLAHGTQDPIVPYPLGLTTKARLEQANFQAIEWHHYPMPHNVCHEEIQDIGKWFQAQLIS